MTRDDTDKLRSQGLSDKDILDIILVTCIFNYNDRMADATGITREDFLKGLVSENRG
jgi:alkylhydroperoxidase family enzyme